MKISNFTKREIYHLQAFCNFTPEEEQIFIMRSKGETIENCAEKLNVSDSTAKRMLKRVYAKIETEQKHMTQN